MSKRFTDTNIWDDGWYQSLPPKYKLLWKYICDRCDIAGAWKKNMALAEFQIGDKLDEVEAVQYFNYEKARVQIFPGVWLLLEFVPFQYGTLHPEKIRFHAAIKQQIDRLSHRLSHRLPGSLMDTLQDKEEDKDRDKGHGIQRGSGGDHTPLSPPLIPGDNPWTIEDCKSAAATIAMPDEMIAEFWAHYAAVGWIDAAKRRITNLSAALAKWKANQPSHGIAARRGERPRTVSKIPE